MRLFLFLYSHLKLFVIIYLEERSLTDTHLANGMRAPFYFNSKAIKANKRQIKIILRSFGTPFG